MSDAAARFRPAERLFLLYFGYTLLLGALVGGLFWRVATVATAVASIIFLVRAHARGVAGARLRDWMPLPLVLVAYWQMDSIRRTVSPVDFARRWLPIDVSVLRWLHIDGAGWGVPLSWLLEATYATTYVIPPLAVGTLYALGRRDRLDHFYATFLGGTLLAYGLLPFLPSASPRVIDPAAWTPPMTSMRHFNIWLLDHADIRTSVFPSGHVAAAASAGFAMLASLPERKPIGMALLVLAAFIALATVYGRYHYVVDVVASVALSVIAWRITAVLKARGQYHGAV